VDEVDGDTLTTETTGSTCRYDGTGGGNKGEGGEEEWEEQDEEEEKAEEGKSRRKRRKGKYSAERHERREKETCADGGKGIARNVPILCKYVSGSGRFCASSGKS
jgi:hypothetical protein